jgi:hypothetical protein
MQPATALNLAESGAVFLVETGNKSPKDEKEDLVPIGIGVEANSASFPFLQRLSKNAERPKQQAQCVQFVND